MQTNQIMANLVFRAPFRQSVLPLAVALWAGVDSAVAQLALPTVVDFAGNSPGVYNDPDYPWDVVNVIRLGGTTAGPFVTPTIPFQDVKLRTQWGRVEVTATYMVSFFIGAGGLSTVDLAMANVALRLTGPGLSNPIELPLATPADPLRATVNRSSPSSTASGSLNRTRTFTVDVGSGLSEVELTLEWATSALTYTQGATITSLANSVAGKVDGNVPVPEPEAFAVVFGLGALAYGFCRRRPESPA